MSASGENCILYGPDHRASPFASVKGYLASLDSSYSNSLYAAAASSRPMHPDCRLTFCLVLAAHQEGKNIYKALTGLSKQMGAVNEYEIFILANHPEINQSGEHVLADSSLSWIKKFQRDKPQIQVSMTYAAFDSRKISISDIRGFATDIVLTRYLNRGNCSRDHLVVSADADSEGYSHSFVQNSLAQFENNPNLDVYLGALQWSASTLSREPLLLWNASLDMILDNLHYEDSGFIPHPGSNSIYRASTYSMVAGYDIDTECAEDIVLREKIMRFRYGSNHEHIQLGDEGVTCYTSARRAVAALHAGFTIQEQWMDDATEFSLDDYEIRSPSSAQISSLDQFNQQLAAEDFEDRLSTILTRAINYKRHLSTPISEDTIQNGLRAIEEKFRCNVVLDGTTFRVRFLEDYKHTFLALRRTYLDNWKEITRIGLSSS